MILGSAPLTPSWGYGLSAEGLFLQALAAHVDKNYTRSLQLSMEVVISSPSHQGARKLIRDSAAELVRRKAAGIEQEATRIGLQAQASHETVQTRRRREGRWTRNLEFLMKERQFLEAYDFLYWVSERHPDELWPQLNLVVLNEMIFYSPTGAVWNSRVKSYREGVQGFSFYYRKEWGKAKACWLEALRHASSELPARPRIQKYLMQVEGELAAADRADKELEEMLQ
jgi:hypothetical protein